MGSSETSIQQLAEAARSMQEKDSTVEMLDEAVGAAIEIIEGCDLAGMSIVNPHGINTPAGSGDALIRLDELQFEMHEGPCFDALRKHEVVIGRNLATDERWPTWGPRVVEEIGVHSIVSYRLFTTEDSLGAMNLYSHSLDAFDDDDIANGGGHLLPTSPSRWPTRRTSRIWRRRSVPARRSGEPKAS